MDHGDRRNGHEAALRAVQRAPAKPWRGAPLAPAPAPPQPKVYRVEPRDFRELVQRLTGARTASASAPAPATGPPAMGVRQAPAPPHAAAAVHGRREAAAAADQQFDYASWFSAPLLSPASMPTGLDGRYGNGALL